MPRRKPEAALAAIALLLAPVPANAQEFQPRTEYEEMIQAPKPLPAIPAEYAGIVSVASPELLLVKALDGGDIPVDIDWMEPEDFHSFAQGRFFGFSFTGYEYYGYVLVDRTMAGEAAVFETGEMPAFSPDGHHFVAAELSDSGFGNLNGVGLWAVLPTGTVRRFFTDALPSAWDWRADGWVREDCVALSAIPQGWWPDNVEQWDAELAAAPRLQYSLELGEGSIALTTSGQSGCAEYAWDE